VINNHLKVYPILSVYQYLMTFFHSKLLKIIGN